MQQRNTRIKYSFSCFQYQTLFKFLLHCATSYNAFHNCSVHDMFESSKEISLFIISSFKISFVDYL